MPQPPMSAVPPKPRQQPGPVSSGSAASTSSSTTPASGTFANVADMSVDDWQQVIDTNLTGVFYCCHAAIPHMRRARRRLDHQHQQPGREEPLHRRRRLLRVEGGPQRVQRSADAGSALRRHPRQLRDARIGRDRLRTRLRGRSAADWKLAPEDVAQVVMDLLAQSAAVCRAAVELRPSKPPRKG